ncbi:MAG: type I 3-dehydroquinate dehydratase [Methanomassiliicoccales archaeon]
MGMVSMLCVSIAEETVEGMTRRAEEAFARGAEAVEFRVDLMGMANETAVNRLAGIKGKKILTLKGKTIHLSHLPSSGAFNYVDIDLNDYLVLKPSIRSHQNLILSTHAPIDGRAARQRIRSALRFGAIAKCVITRNGYDACASVMRVSSSLRSQRVIAFSLGEKGVLSRIKSLRDGAPVSYCALSKAATVAPGQLTLEEMRAAAKGLLLGILGSKRATDHSLSPYLQEKLLHLSHLAGIYLRFPCETAELTKFLACAKLAGVNGFNVTMPLKQIIVRHIRFGDETAKEIGAVNTVVRTGTGWSGFNTDAAAIKEVVSKLRVKSALILGAGGAARAAACVLSDRHVAVLGRREERRRELIRRFGLSMERPGGHYDMLINCTPIGMTHGDRLPQELTACSFGHVINMVYRPVSNPFLLLAKRNGAGYTDGIELLLRQAIHSFRLWTGKHVPYGKVSNMLEDLL